MVTDRAEIDDAVERYARRYRRLSDNPDRIVLRLTPDKVMCSAYMAA
ncbi:hypothetical protein [Paraoerskovia sediminicola]|nr:hypothetical protein [Paraoerskovia sediminicola]